jgi:NAD(P)H-hydrate epimerase
MLGSGARGTPRAPLDKWIELANAASARRIAIDIPTGLDADAGDPAAVTLRAHHTLTFVARKPGFHQPQAQEFLGEVDVLPIGIPVELVEELLAQSEQR